MTEKKEEEKASNLILKEIANLKVDIASLRTLTAKPSEHEEKTEGHQTIEEMLECPNCYPKLRDGVVKKEGFKPPLGKREPHEYPFKCKGCGLNVKKDEEKCPNCGDTHAY